MLTPRGYDNSVFINCPFDVSYRPLFEAVVFAVYACGFHPRCAMEAEDRSQVRIEKIIGIIRDCRLSVHDISRTQLDAANRLPRFNMPLELGMFLGAKAFGGKDQRLKAAIILDNERYRYQKYISDIAGQDIRSHGRRVDEAVRQVRMFLSAQCEPGVLLPGADRIVARYACFRRELRGTCGKLHLTTRTLTFSELTTLVVGWLQAHPMPAGRLEMTRGRREVARSA